MMTCEERDEATDGQIHYRTAPAAATALNRYHTQLDAHGYMATEAFMDNMLLLKALMKAIDPNTKRIEDVPSSMNPYHLLILKCGSTKHEWHRLGSKEYTIYPMAIPRTAPASMSPTKCTPRYIRE